MIFWLILGALFCATFNEAWKGRELPPRYWAVEAEKELKHQTDSALNNWKEMALNDTTWMRDSL